MWKGKFTFFNCDLRFTIATPVYIDKKKSFFFKSIHYQWISISLIIMLVYLLYYLISVFTLRITFLTKPEKNVCRCKFYDNVCLHGLYYLRSQLDQFPTFNEHCSLRYKKEFCNSLQKCKKTIHTKTLVFNLSRFTCEAITYFCLHPRLWLTCIQCVNKSIYFSNNRAFYCTTVNFKEGWGF